MTQSFSVSDVMTLSIQEMLAHLKKVVSRHQKGEDDNNCLDNIFLQFFRKKGASPHQQGVGDNNWLHRH